MGGVTGSNDPTVTNWGNIGSQGAHVSDGPEGSQFNGFEDGTSSLGGASRNNPYLQDIGTPQLQQATLGLSDQPNGQHGDTYYTPEHAYYDSFGENLEQLIDKHGLSEEQANKLVMSHLTEAPSDDTFINEVLSELDGQLASDMAEMFELPSTANQAKNLREKAGNHSSALNDQISDLQAYADSLPEGSEKQAIQNKINEMRQNLDGFNQNLSSLPENASREQLAKLATELGQSGENLRSIAEEFSNLAGDKPELQAVLANLQSSVNSATTQLDGLLQELQVSYELSQGDFSSLTESFKNMYVGKLTHEFDAAFEAQLEKFTEDPEMQAQLRFAHYNPDAEVPGHIKSGAQTVEQNAINQMNLEGWNIPEGYTPPSNGKGFNDKMEMAADDIFNSILQNFEPPMPPDQQKALRNMYFGLTEPTGDLAGILKTIEAEVAGELALAFGLPDGFPIPKGVSHRAEINGKFQMKFMELLNALPADQKAKVLQAINDPMNPAISGDTKALLNQLFKAAAGAVGSEFGLPEGWVPAASVLKSTGTMTPRQKSVVNQVNEMETEVALAISYVEQWPNSPTKALLLNVLKIVSDALANLKSQIAIMMQKDTELSTKLGQAQLDTALTKVHENLKKLEEIKEKQAKMKSLGPLMKFMKILTFIFTAVLCLAAGPVGWAIMGTMIYDMIEHGLDSDESTMGKMFEAIQKAVADICKSLGLPEKLTEFVTMAVKYAVCVGIVWAGGAALGMQMFFEQSGVIQQLFTDVFGCPELVGEIMAMSIQIIIEIIIMIVISVVTAGVAAPLIAGVVTAKVAMMTAKALQFVVKVLMMIARTIMKVAKAAQKVSRILGKIVKTIARGLQKFAARMQKIARKLIDWAKETERLIKEVVKNMNKLKKVSKAKKFKNVFRGESKTGVDKFDDAANKLSDKLNLAKTGFAVLGATTSGMQAVTAGIQFNNSIVAAQIARLRGDMEAMMAELEAFIQVLKKMVAKILEALSGAGEWIGQIGQQQGSMWKEMSETLDAVAASNQAS